MSTDMSVELSVNPVQLEVMDPVADAYGEVADPLAPRPETLDGKVVGLLWNAKPNGDVGLRTVAEVIEERFTGVEVRLYHGAIRCEAQLMERVAAECDVVVSCAADCGACTSWLIHDCAVLERRGLPTVTIVARGFEGDAAASGSAFGMPDIPFVLVPRVYVALTQEQARAQSRPVVDEIVRLLTSAPDSSAGDVAEIATRPSLSGGVAEHTFVGTDSFAAWEAFNEHFIGEDWGDGYPLLPPTPQRVRALVDAAGAEPSDMVCLVPPARGHGTVGKVAVSAAMAGCTPDELLVVVAALRAISKTPPPLNLSAMMSTGAYAPLIMVNGPIAQRIGINGGRSCLGPGRENRANIRIGRAVVLALKTLGRWIPGVMDLDTIGTPRKFNLCLAENEAESPWEPYHVSRGYRPEDSTVTMFHTTGDWDIVTGSDFDAEHLLRSLASRTPTSSQVGPFAKILGGLALHEDGRLVMIPPEHAQAIADAGISKQEAERFLQQHIRASVADLIESQRRKYAEGSVRPEWKRLFELSPEEARRETMPAFVDPDMIKVAVVGHGTPKEMVFGVITAPITEPVPVAGGI